MQGEAVIFSKGKDDWQTPPDLFARLHAEFAFTLDGAADAHNHLLPRWLGPGGIVEDALSVQDNHGEVIFCNPPYSMCAEFVQWASFTARNNGGCTVVLLIPARTDTRWWHQYIWNTRPGYYHGPYQGDPRVEIRFIKGRVKFIDGSGASKSNSAPFPSAIIVFRR